MISRPGLSFRHASPITVLLGGALPMVKFAGCPEGMRNEIAAAVVRVLRLGSGHTPQAPVRSGTLTYRDDICTSLQLVQIIRPLLHHFFAFRQVRRAVVGASIRIAHGMG